MDSPPENIRAFVCIEFPSEVIKEVARVQEILSQKKFTGKLTELENLHLTLKFLGEITPEKLDEVKAELRKIKFPPIYTLLEYAGTFNHRSSPKIAWIKVGGPQIPALQKQIDTALTKLGFEPEARFMSHLTIARIKYVKDKKDFTEHVKKIPVKKIKFPIESFQLKSSQLHPMGPIYTTLQEYPAAKSA